MASSITIIVAITAVVAFARCTEIKLGQK